MFILPFFLAFLARPALMQPAATLQPRHDCPKEDAPSGQDWAYDLLIAATALARGEALATLNQREFACVPGLRLTPVS